MTLVDIKGVRFEKIIIIGMRKYLLISGCETDR